MSERVEVLEWRGAARLVRISASDSVALRLERFDEADLDYDLVAYLRAAGDTLAIARAIPLGLWWTEASVDGRAWRERLLSARTISDFKRLLLAALLEQAGLRA